MANQNISYSAEYMKAKLIDYFLSQYGCNNIAIGNEVMYGTSRKVVDLLLLKSKSLIAIEIKSEKDNLARLKEQIIEYHKNFNQIIICTTEKHLAQIRKTIDCNIGIILFKDGNVKTVKEPSLRKRLNKTEMLHSIPSTYLKQKADKNINSLNSDETRVYFEKKTLKEIQELYFQYMFCRIESNYKLFISERGLISHEDDIPLLSSRYNKVNPYSSS